MVAVSVCRLNRRQYKRIGGIHKEGKVIIMDRDQINAKNERNLYDYSRPDAVPVLEGLLLDGTLPVQAPWAKKAGAFPPL